MTEAAIDLIHHEPDFDYECTWFGPISPPKSFLVQQWTLGYYTAALLALGTTASDRFKVSLIADLASSVNYHRVTGHEHVGSLVRIEPKQVFNAAVVGK